MHANHMHNTRGVTCRHYKCEILRRMYYRGLQNQIIGKLISERDRKTAVQQEIRTTRERITATIAVRTVLTVASAPK